MDVEPRKPDLSNRVALVTGAGSGVGRAVAAMLAAHGAAVAMAGRRMHKLDETVEHIRAANGVARGFECNVSHWESVRALGDKVRGELGPLSIVVNNAGVHGEFSTILDGDPLRWAETIQINLVGAYFVNRAFGPAMRDAGWGRIINVSSAASLAPPNGLNSAYPLSKRALNDHTRQLAAELEGTGVTVNAIHPGEVKTEMWESIRDDAHARGDECEGARGWAKMVEESGGDPPHKAAELVIRLVDSDVTGQFHWIDGGIQEPRPVW